MNKTLVLVIMVVLVVMSGVQALQINEIKQEIAVGGYANVGSEYSAPAVSRAPQMVGGC